MRGWQEVDRNVVLLAPAHTFLMMNQPVDHQFWLDIGSRGGYERLYQPLTHPYVLAAGSRAANGITTTRTRPTRSALPAGGRVAAPLPQNRFF